MELMNRVDDRGMSFTAPAEALEVLGNVSDMHLASTKRGAVRGNHYHLRRGEDIVVLPGCRWSLHSDRSSTGSRRFNGNSAILGTAAPGASHAVRNDGEAKFWLIAFSSEIYDPAETAARKVV